ncbi:MAG: hypothetical protein FWB91_08990 [Defluviitaleaceae bacterium]|nr:hypothetical protein [Defluviitaleaceae bacterium]
MGEFVILIGELVFIAVLHGAVRAAFSEYGMNRHIPVLNIACVLISYALLIRFVYNHFLEELAVLVNYSF